MASNALRIGLLPLVLLTLATGCDDEENNGSAEGGANSELEDIVDGAVALSEEASEVLSGTCDCWEAFGFASQEECDTATEVEDVSFDRDCLLEALSMDVDAAIENFTCERPALEDLITCITAALDVCDINAFTACIAAPEPDCTELPPEVDTATEACIGT